MFVGVNINHPNNIKYLNNLTRVYFQKNYLNQGMILILYVANNQNNEYNLRKSDIAAKATIRHSVPNNYVICLSASNFTLILFSNVAKLIKIILLAASKPISQSLPVYNRT